MNRVTWVLATCGAVVVISACSGSPSPGPDTTSSEQTKGSSVTPSQGSSKSPPSDPGSSDTPPPAGSSSSSSSSSSGSSGASGADLACASQGSSCQSCCETNHGSGSTIYWNAWTACLCTGARCQAQCAKTDCSEDDNSPNSSKGDACDLCEEQYLPSAGGGECEAPIKAACTGDADCAAFQTCFDACQ